MNLLADRRTKTIWDTFAPGRALGIIQQVVDDEPLTGRTVRVRGREFVNFVSCSYLGLELDPRVIDGVATAARRYGAAFSASRTYASAPPYAEFERLLARISGAYPVVATTTTLGHFSFMSVMIQPGDVVLLDQQVHNSVQLAAQTVAHKAKLVPVRHNDLGRLERAVVKYLAEPGTNHVWYCGDGVYSMYGDVAPVGELLHLLDRHERLYCYLDDAHGMSTQGRHGRGYVLSQMDRMHDRLVVAVSFAKCFGMGGGAAILLPRAEWQDVLRTCGATMIFSGPISPPMLGGGIASAKIHLADGFPALLADLRQRVSLFRSEAAGLGLRVLSSERSPIQYVLLGDFERALCATRAVFDAGYMVNICAYPAVALNHAGIRLTVTRHVTASDIRGVLGAIHAAVRV
jgi:7-keto-8-aminopelargonate synthetase-like enzyme